MALEASLIIGNNNGTARTVKYETRKQVADGSEDLVFVVDGVVDVAADGQVNIPLAGRGLVLDQPIKNFFTDFNGSNHDASIDAVGWSVVTDDGAAPPTLLKFMDTGDSQTDQGGTGATTGNRPTNKYVGVTQNGFWVCAAHILSGQDYLYAHHMGKAGDTVSGMVTRVPDIRAQAVAKGVDVVGVMIGTNDSHRADVEPVKLAYTQLITELRAGGIFEVLIAPVPHRNDDVNYAARNTFIDALNAHAATLAANMDGVNICPIPTQLNAAIMAETNGAGGDVTVEGLHMIAKGAMMFAEESVATTMADKYPSQIADKFNLLPSSLVGTGGAVGSGGTGTCPDDTRGYWASPRSGVGFESVVIDEVQWERIKMNGGVPSNANNKAKFRFYPYRPCIAGRYAMDVKIVVENDAHLLTRFQLALSDSGGTYSYAEIAKNTDTDGAFETGREYTLTTPSAFFVDGEFDSWLELEQAQGNDVSVRVAGFNVYKVEDLPV